MKILTKSHADWHATLNVVSTGRNQFGWEVDVHNPQATPIDQIVTSPVQFADSSVAAVDGLRALESMSEKDVSTPASFVANGRRVK